MTTPPNAPEKYSLLVFGKPTSADLPQASWFRAEDRTAVFAAAQSLKFSVLDIATIGDLPPLDGVHEGVLKGTGRMIVGSVTPQVYKRIDDCAAKAANALAVKAPTEPPASPKSSSEQKANDNPGGAISAAPPVGAPSVSATASGSIASPADNTQKPATAGNPWETLRVGSRVLAAYWDKANEFEGFWLATVKRIEPGELTLEWFESPDYPPFKAAPKNIAVPHPEFRHLRK